MTTLTSIHAIYVRPVALWGRLVSQHPIYLHHEWISLLISFNLPSIPSPTTALPFLCFGIGALLHPKQILYVYSAGKSKGLQNGRRVEEGSKFTRILPDRFGRIEFAYATDWNFSSGCSPPFLTETQLPLSDTGR